MKVLFDTNVIIDIWTKDPERFLDSFAAYDVCVMRGWEPHIAVTAVPDIEYLLTARGVLPEQDVATAMGALFEMFSVIDMQECDCLSAMGAGLPDLERGILAQAAQRNGMDAIITRHVDDLATSPVPALAPADFLRTYKPANVEYDEADF